MVRTRVLVASEEEYRAYREVIAAGVRLLRPRAEVSAAAPAELEAKIALLDPQVVVCRAPLPGDSAQASDILEVTRSEDLLSDHGRLLNPTLPSWGTLRRSGRVGRLPTRGKSTEWAMPRRRSTRVIGR